VNDFDDIRHLADLDGGAWEAEIHLDFMRLQGDRMVRLLTPDQEREAGRVAESFAWDLSEIMEPNWNGTFLSGVAYTAHVHEPDHGFLNIFIEESRGFAHTVRYFQAFMAALADGLPPRGVVPESVWGSVMVPLTGEKLPPGRTGGR
jgi:hypothetical protein